MKAPDKIYVLPPEEDVVFNYLTDLSLENTYEYVRKDAIVEWAEHMNGIYPAGAFQMMIDKLNSL